MHLGKIKKLIKQLEIEDNEVIFSDALKLEQKNFKAPVIEQAGSDGEGIFGGDSPQGDEVDVDGQEEDLIMLNKEYSRLFK